MKRKTMNNPPFALSRAIFAAAAFCVCAGAWASGGSETGLDSAFNPKKEITVLSRENGSGTRSAFIELSGVEKPNAAGVKTDYTTIEALITNSTAVMMTSVSGDLYAVGYISLGFLNDSVKALSIDGAPAAVGAIQDGSYPFVRSFNLITKAQTRLSPAAQDFFNFITSAEGQTVVESNGFIPVDSTGEYKAAPISGKVVVAGSSSVTPLMEKLKEAYLVRQPAAVIEIQQSDSTTGIMSAKNGICDIGMASRELKADERDSGLDASIIARDGIAIIVNNGNPLGNISKDTLGKIFTGDITAWESVLE